MSTTQPENSLLELTDFGLPTSQVTVLTPFKNSARGYPRRGPSGISQESGLRSHPVDCGGETSAIVIATTYRNESGAIVGVLHQYPGGLDIRVRYANKKPGEYFIIVHSSYRRLGIGGALLAAADEKWGLDFWHQDYSNEGRALALKYLRERFSSLN
jgi:GNAT superfamily N-acetyltransferase